MPKRDYYLVFTVCIMLTGCAAQQRQTVTYDEPPAERWVGSMQPTQQRSGNVGVAGKNKTFGSVTIRQTSMGTMQRMHVSLTLSMPVTSQQLRWAVLPDRCGSGDLPLIGFEQFPLLEIGANGRGQVDADLPLEMTPNNTYHVNVYQGGQQLDNVVSCGNIKYEQPKP